MNEHLDVIIFGASGFTGKRVVATFHRIITKEKRKVKWGIAGRSPQKLQDVLDEIETSSGEKLTLPVIIADVKNEDSIKAMTLRTRLIVNCTGPYKLYGEPVVRACVQQKCHYIDVCAEPQFMEYIQLVYDEEASRRGVYLVTGCGFDSIPFEMGMVYLQRNFKGTLNSIEFYLESPDFVEKLLNCGPVANYATYEGLIDVLSDYHELKKIRMKLFKPLPELKPKLPVRWVPHKVPKTDNKYAVPYPGGEATVMRRSQRYFYEKNKSRPVQIHTYLALQKFWHGLICFVVYFFGLFIMQFKFGVKLLKKFPKFFAWGVVANQHETKNITGTSFIFTLYGRGWKSITADEKYNKPEDTWVMAKITGYDAYEMTAICTTLSALIITDSKEKLPETGGVYTTAPFFIDTNLIEQLRQNSIKFEMMGDGPISNV